MDVSGPDSEDMRGYGRLATRPEPKKQRNETGDKTVFCVTCR